MTRYRPDLAVLSAATAPSRWVPTTPRTPASCWASDTPCRCTTRTTRSWGGPQCGDLFRAAAVRVAPQTAVTLLRPGQTTTLRVTTATR